MNSFKNLFQIFFTASILLLFSIGTVAAQNFSWNGSISNDWSTGANWNGGNVPNNGSNVTIPGNTPNAPVISSDVNLSQVTIGNYNGIASLTIQNGATLTITNSLSLSGGGQVYINNGNVDITGSNFTQVYNANTFVEMTSGSFSVQGDVDIIGGNSTTPGFSIGSGSVFIEGNFKVSNNKLFDAGSGTLNVQGTTEINGTFDGGDGVTDFYDTADIRSGGIINLDTGTITFHENAAIRNNGTLNMGDGSVIFNSDIQVESSGYVNVQDGNMTVNGDAQFQNNGNISSDTGSINISGDASLQNGGEMNLNAGSLDVGGNASVTNGGTMNAGSANIDLQGDFTIQNQSNFNSDSSTVTFSGDENQTVNVGNGDITFYNVVVEDGSTFQTDGSNENTVFIENNLTVSEGGTVIIEDNDQIDIQGTLDDEGENIIIDKPFLRKIETPSLTQIDLEFDKDMVTGTVENTANYSVDNGITVNSAVQDPNNGRFVTLTVSTLSEGIEYQLTINNVEATNGFEISPDHIKKFRVKTKVIFYSRQNGNWSVNSTWSTDSHNGTSASKNPTNTPNSTVIIGAGHTISVISGVTITNLDSVAVDANSKLDIDTGGVFNLGSKIIFGAGTFEVSDGKIIIGSTGGISASGSTGNIQTITRNFSSTGEYTYNGTNEQVTGSGLPSQISELDIDNNNNVRATNNIEVTGTLYLTNGSLIISSGNNLIANTKNISSGDLIMERIIAGSTGWRMISSPLSTSYEDLLDSTVTQGFTGAFYSTGSIPGDTLQPNVLYYDETYPGTDNQRWRAPNSASNTIPEAQGLYTFFFGDIDSDPLYNNQFPLPTTLTVQGQEHDGDGNSVDFDVTYTASADSGWNLVGNPYAATIDWDDGTSWTKTNIDNTIYVWDSGVNSFKTWNGTTGDLDSEGLIAPFQGFWIKANDMNPILEVTEDAKTFDGAYTGKVNSKKEDFPAISLTISNDTLQAYTHFMFSTQASIGKDISDAYRLVPPPGIGNFVDINSVTENGTRLAINNLPRHFGRAIEIPIYVNAYSQGISSNDLLTLSISKLKNIPHGWDIELRDNYIKNKLNLEDSFSYSFTYQGNSDHIAPNFGFAGRPKITSKNSDSEPRFTLIIHPGEDGADLPASFNLEQNYPNPFNPSTNIQFDLPVQSYTEITVFSILGQRLETIVQEELSAGTHKFTWDASGYASGVYLYRMISDEIVITKQMTLIK